MAEWLRREPAKLVGSARQGSNPCPGVVIGMNIDDLLRDGFVRDKFNLDHLSLKSNDFDCEQIYTKFRLNYSGKVFFVGDDVIESSDYSLELKPHGTYIVGHLGGQVIVIENLLDSTREYKFGEISQKAPEILFMVSNGILWYHKGSNLLY